MKIFSHKLLGVQMTEPLSISRVQSIGINTCHYIPTWDSFTNPEGRHFQHMDVRLVLTKGHRQAKIKIGLLFELTLHHRLRKIQEDADTSWEIVHLAMETAADIFVLEAEGTPFAGTRPPIESPVALRREMSLQGCLNEDETDYYAKYKTIKNERKSF